MFPADQPETAPGIAPARNATAQTLAIAVAGLVAIAAAIAFPTQVYAQDHPDVVGKWKLTVIANGLDEFAIFDIKKDKDAKTYAASIVSSARFFTNPSVKSLTCDGNVVTMAISSTSLGNAEFTGKIDKANPKIIPGVFKLRKNPYPAELEVTEADKVAPTANREITNRILKARSETNPAQRAKAFEQIFADKPNHAVLDTVYEEYLSTASTPNGVNLEPSRVAKALQDWIAQSQRYGDQWAHEVRIKALTALKNQKPYAELTLKLGQETDKAGADVVTSENRVKILEAIQTAALSLGKAEVARDAQTRAETITAQLDEEYRKTVPPFPVKPRSRDNGKATKVVLMELFTGAECPPCVAADVAFDALAKTYKPADVILLQYHLHVPGPDPLTNDDSIQRSKYYQVRGTPSTYFNGKSLAGGGGYMDKSEAKFSEYQTIIEPILSEGEKPAELNVTASRTGNAVTVHATGKILNPPKDADLRIRFALVEESIRYVGGNGLRFHHHVVRAIHDKPKDENIQGDSIDKTVVFDIDKIRQSLENYLTDYESKSGKFRRANPPVALKDLHVVVFIQDQASKEILHAVEVDIKTVNP